MSELTPCNYCNLNSIRRHAKERRLTGTTKANEDGWTDVYVHPPNVTEFPVDKNGERSEYFALSMMQITDHCVC